MKFSINRAILLEEIYKANKILDSKNPNPTIGGIFLELTMDKLTIISTNTVLSFKSVLTNSNADLDINEPGKILIKGRYVIEMLRRLDDQFVNFTAVENSELRISTNSSEFNINILDAEDYPSLGFREKGTILELDAHEFKRTLAQSLISIDEWSKKLSLSGLNVHVVEDKVVFSATDLFRITQKTININEKHAEEINITIPYKTLLELPKLVENAKTMKIVISDGYVTFVINNVLFQSNLIDGQFPNVSAAFPTEFATVVYVESKKLLKTLNRADLPNDDGLPQIINLRIENDRIYVKSTVSEVGNYEEEFTDFKLEGTGNLVISFNSKFLLDALKTFDNDPIKLQFVNPTRPVIICKQSSDELKQVVLPTYLGN